MGGVLTLFCGDFPQTVVIIKDSFPEAVLKQLKATVKRSDVWSHARTQHLTERMQCKVGDFAGFGDALGCCRVVYVVVGKQVETRVFFS